MSSAEDHKITCNDESLGAAAHPQGEQPGDYKYALAGSDDDFSSDADGLDDRDGRFHGPDSSWRLYTREERALAASLDQVDNDNLSIHLYNAHKWKERLYNTELASNHQPWRSKRSWILRDETGHLPFLPRPQWTAWPLAPEDVPRRMEWWGVTIPDSQSDAETYRKAETWRPSLEIQDALTAEILRMAHQSFKKRTWESTGSSTAVAKSSPYSAPDCDTSLSINKVDGEAKESSAATATQYVSATMEWDVGTQSAPAENMPSFMADDEMSSRILKPTVRHLIGKLDRVLTALHHSRQGHRSERSISSGRGSRSLHGSSSSHSGSVVMSRKRKRTVVDTARLDEAENSPEVDFDQQSHPAHSPSPPRRRRAKRHKLGTRDWSEVLGSAALSGWNPDVIDRAARRCAALFGEGMNMRLMLGLHVDHAQEENISYTPEMIPTIDESFDMVEIDQHTGNGKTELDQGDSGFHCPVRTCPRHAEPYEKRWRLREHLKRKHGKLGEEIETLVASDAAIDREAPRHSSEAYDGTTTDMQAQENSPPAFLKKIEVPIGRSKDRGARKTRNPTKH